MLTNQCRKVIIGPPKNVNHFLVLMHQPRGAICTCLCEIHLYLIPTGVNVLYSIWDVTSDDDLKNTDLWSKYDPWGLGFSLLGFGMNKTWRNKVRVVSRMNTSVPECKSLFWCWCVHPWCCLHLVHSDLMVLKSNPDFGGSY